jgi:hypothetical protein
MQSGISKKYFLMQSGHGKNIFYFLMQSEVGLARNIFVCKVGMEKIFSKAKWDRKKYFLRQSGIGKIFSNANLHTTFLGRVCLRICLRKQIT